MARREALLKAADTTTARLFNSHGDGCPGLVIERLGDVLIAQLHEGVLAQDEDDVRSACETLSRQLACRAVYRKIFPRDRSGGSPAIDRAHHDAVPWIGAPCDAEFAVCENGLRFLVHPYDGFSTGLFLEHRDNRGRIRALAQGRRVLNAFAYTCGFSIAAAAGGAAATVSVDVAVKFLEWGKRNFAANNIALDQQRFICSDIFDYYARARRQRQRFDVIILDPPTFSRTKKPARIFSIRENLPELLRGALELLDSGGHLLLSTNHRETPLGALEARVHEAARQIGRTAEIVERPALPSDFAGDPQFARSLIARIT